jgi:hypothetical protein
MPPQNQNRRPPTLTAWLLAFVLVPQYLLLRRRAGKANRRAERWISEACAQRGVLVLNLVDHPPQTIIPLPQGMKAEVEQLFGRRVPRHFGRPDLVQLWNRRFTEVLWRHPKILLYSAALQPRHDPPRTPFEVEHDGGGFIFLTNRSEPFLTYLFDPALAPDEHSLADSFSMGYTNLWICEHVKTCLPPAGARPAMPPSTPNDQRPGTGPWAVLSDPEVSPQRGLLSFSIVRARVTDRADAEARAEEFALRFGVAACVARILKDCFWH